MAVAEQEIQWLQAPTVESGGPSLIEFLCGSLAVLWKDWPRDMNCTVLNHDNNSFSLSGTCPHCSLGAVFMPVTKPHSEPMPLAGRVLGPSLRLCVAMQCQGCKRFILGIVYRNGSIFHYQEHYPLDKPNDSVDQNVPDPIAADFSEALRCLWVKAFKAAVIMCGRAIEASCNELGAQGTNLNDQIDDLAKKGAITEPLRQWAHAVRLTRNREVHGKALASATQEDAEAIVAFTGEYFHHVYVMPAKLQAFKAPKVTTSATSGPATPPATPRGAPS